MTMALKTLFFTLSILVIIFSYYKESYVSYEAYYNAEQSIFFNFISDPLNFKTINPTITDLAISESTGSSVKIVYAEHLVQIPFVFNYATAQYKIEDKGLIWKLESHHKTCFLFELFCLPTNSTISVRAAEQHTVHYKEEIHFVCPWLLLPFCSQEVYLQRQIIMNNLARIFKTPKIITELSN